mgnify:CR=1 FL=1
MPAHVAVWPARLPARITAPATSLWMNLAVSAMRYPEKAALVFMGQVWTYRVLMAGAEETGLWGSKAYSAAHIDEPIAVGLESDFGRQLDGRHVSAPACGVSGWRSPRRSS